MANQLFSQVAITNPQNGTLTFDSSNFILQSITGLEYPAIRLPRYNLPGQTGANVSNQLYGERIITIKGVCNGSNVSSYLTNRSTISNVLSIARDNNNNLQPLVLSFTLANGNAFTANCYTSKELTLSFGEDQIEWATFQIQLVAPDPSLYSTTSSSNVVTLPVQGPVTGISGIVQTVGSGQHDLTSGGAFTDTIGHTYTIVIQSGGTTFKWKTDSGALSGAVTITGSAQTLANGVTVTFGHTSGYTNGDTFTIVATYGVQIASALGPLTGTALGISLAPASGGQVTINNPGGLPVYPTITITAPIVNPYIVNLRTGAFLRITDSLLAGANSLVINCAAQTIFQGSNNVTGIQSSDSTFWDLLPGSNTIGFNASSGSGQATVQFFPTFIGI